MKLFGKKKEKKIMLLWRNFTNKQCKNAESKNKTGIKILGSVRIVQNVWN